MTIIDISDRAGGGASSKRWLPTWTEKEAALNGIPKKLYQSLVAFSRMVVNDHIQLGTPRQLWEPQTTQADHFTSEFIEQAEDDLGMLLDRDADPELDEAHALLEDCAEMLGTLQADVRPIGKTETGANYSVAEAVDQVELADTRIEEDSAQGVHIHGRVSPWLRWFGSKAPWFEAAGMLAFVTLFLNVQLWRPQDDILGWSFALAVVVVTITGQLFLVHPAAEAHNHMREHEAAGNRHEAADSRARRNKFLVGAGIVTGAITGAMIYRGLAALGDAEWHISIIMVALAALTGILMPLTAFLAVALDGSSVSRQRDDLAAVLDQDAEDDLRTRDDVKRNLDAVAGIRETLNEKTFPGICAAVQETVDRVYFPYNAARMLIGGLTSDPPVKTPMTIDIDNTTGRIGGRIGTGIPGARSVDLRQLFDRCGRLAVIERQRGLITTQLEAIPPHPWARHRH